MTTQTTEQIKERIGELERDSAFLQENLNEGSYDGWPPGRFRVQEDLQKMYDEIYSLRKALQEKENT